MHIYCIQGHPAPISPAGHCKLQSRKLVYTKTGLPAIIGSTVNALEPLNICITMLTLSNNLFENLSKTTVTECKT